MAEQKDDFEAAFAQFSVPEDKATAAETDAAAAAAAAADKGGQGDGSGDAGAAAAGGEPGAAADAGAGDGGAATDAGAEAGAADDKSGAGAAADDKGAAAAAGDGQGGAAAAGDAGAAAAEPARGGDAAAAPNADDVLAQLSKLVAEAKPAEAAAGEAKPAAEEAKPPFTDDEAKQLEQYDKDWPDVAKCEALKRRGEYQELLGFVFGEVQKVVQPLMDTLDALAGRAHLADVKAAVPDYNDNLRQQVVDWVAKQPAYLQTAYNHVIQNGTHDEVKDLVERYRQATGVAAPAAGAASTGGQGGKPAKDNELSGAAKEAAAALAPVESKRSEVIAGGDPSTFEDAWSQFAKDVA